MMKAGIFDVGGVLHDNSTPYIFADIKATLEIDEKTLQNAWHKPMQLLGKGQISEKEFWDTFVKRARVTKTLPKESLLLRAFAKHYGRHDDVLRIVHNLKLLGLRLAVLSNTISPHAEYQKKIGIYKQFDVTVLSCKTGFDKSAPEAYDFTLTKLKTKPAETFLVDDEAKYVELVNKLGIHGILYQNPNQLLRDLRNLGIKI